jgi:hypothetical protein
MLRLMRSLHLRACLLLVVASLAALQPIARQRAGLLAAGSDPEQIVICSAHGVMVLGSDGAPVPAPDQEKPACPWCAISAASAGQLPALAIVPIGVLAPPLKLHAAMAAIAVDPQLPRRQRTASSPRAPPEGLRT